MAEDSGAVEAAVQQQSSFPPHSAPAVVPASIPVEKSEAPQPEAHVYPSSVLPDAILTPIAAPAPVPSQNPSDSIQPVLYKINLHEYTQKSRIPLPVYQTVDEGSEGLHKYRSTVLVDEVCYVSPNTFRNRKGAEQDAARIALEYISKKTKDDGFLLLQENNKCDGDLNKEGIDDLITEYAHDLMLCKTILSEYTDKMNLKKPMYETKQHKGSVPIFQSALVFDGVVYTGDVSKSKKEAEQLAARAAILFLIGDAGNPKSQKSLAEIISSKVRLHATLQKSKDLHPSQIQPKPMPENTQEHVAMVVNEDKEVKDAILVNGVVSGAISEVPPTMTHFQPEFRSTKPEASSPPVRLPIEFVPQNIQEHVEMVVNEDKEVKDVIFVNGVVSGVISEAPPTMIHFRPEFRSIKLEASSPPVRLPIEFVPSTVEDPKGDLATGSKKRSKNKKKAHKKLCLENRVAIAAGTSQMPPPCSVAQRL